VLAEIKADEKLVNIPVLALTASTSDRDMFRAKELQADSYITKPVEFMRFLEVVREVESFFLFVVALLRVPVSGDLAFYDSTLVS
jgi:CheY-like chemotaxis protein